MKADRGLTVERMTGLARISRAGFYRFEENAGPGGDADMDLRHAIQRIALNGRATDGGASPRSYVDTAGR